MSSSKITPTPNMIYSARAWDGDNVLRLEVNTGNLSISHFNVEEEEVVELYYQFVLPVRCIEWILQTYYGNMDGRRSLCTRKS